MITIQDVVKLSITLLQSAMIIPTNAQALEGTSSSDLAVVMKRTPDQV